jgi:hypothetical protein
MKQEQVKNMNQSPCRLNYEGFEEYDPTALGESSGKECFFSFVFMVCFSFSP